MGIVKNKDLTPFVSIHKFTMTRGTLTAVGLLYFGLMLFLSIWADLGKSSFGRSLGLPEAHAGAEETYAAIAESNPYQVDGLRATFSRDGYKWTIVGANAPIVTPTVRPLTWPVKGNTFDALVIPEPITNYKILPWTEPIQNAIRSDTISIQSSPGQYEPASFVIRSGDIDLKKITVTVSNLTKEELTGTALVIPAKNVDVRIVKCWYQAGKEIWVEKTRAKTLTPELLLKDDSIVQVNHDYQVNVIRNFESVQDSAALLPFNLNKRENKQIWLTIFVPSDASAGLYKGTIVVKADGCVPKLLSLQINVLPFRLEQSALFYTMFHDADLLPEGGPATLLTSVQRSPERMLAELEDMKAHGIMNPTVYQRQWKPEVLLKILDLRKQAGFGNESIYYVTWPHLSADYAKLNEISAHCEQAVQLLKGQGVNEIFFYGFDELAGAQLEQAIPTYKGFQDRGAKTFVAGNMDFFTKLGNALDLPIIWGAGGTADKNVLKNVAKLAHESGKKVWIYSFPQGGVEEPETYRRNFGLVLWKMDFDGACNYTYQGWMYNVWDDFDHPSHRDEVMAYPTINGVIPTIQWEGWREAVNDVRWLTLLLRQKSLSSDPGLNGTVNNWLQTMDPAANLYTIRNQMIQFVQQYFNNPPHPPTNVKIVP